MATTQKQSFYVKVNQNFQVTIPALIRRGFNIEKGDLVEAQSTKQGILLKPKVVLDKLSEVELSEKWEKMLQQGLEDIKKGRVYGPYDSAKDLLRDLKK